MKKPYRTYCCRSFIERPLKETRKSCPRCGSKQWYPPTLLERLGEAWEAWKMIPVHRKQKDGM